MQKNVGILSVTLSLEPTADFQNRCFSLKNILMFSHEKGTLLWILAGKQTHTFFMIFLSCVLEGIKSFCFVLAESVRKVFVRLSVTSF